VQRLQVHRRRTLLGRGTRAKQPRRALKQLRLPAVTWVGCTLCSCASSASVFSPLSAANATLALNAGLWFRRVRLDMSAPDPRQSSPRSGRKSTYRTVQIRPATSPFVHLPSSIPSDWSHAHQPPAARVITCDWRSSGAWILASSRSIRCWPTPTSAKESPGHRPLPPPRMATTLFLARSRRSVVIGPATVSAPTGNLKGRHSHRIDEDVPLLALD